MSEITEMIRDEGAAEIFAYGMGVAVLLLATAFRPDPKLAKIIFGIGTGITTCSTGILVFRYFPFISETGGSLSAGEIFLTYTTLLMMVFGIPASVGFMVFRD
jgi:hypothetical protein